MVDGIMTPTTTVNETGFTHHSPPNHLDKPCELAVYPSGYLKSSDHTLKKETK